MVTPFLQKLQSLSSLKEETIVALRELFAEPREASAKQDLIREGDRPGPLFVILSGWACRYKILPNGSRQVMAFLMPGDACDLNIGLLSEMDHSIQTISPVTYVTISRETMESTMVGFPDFARAMYIAQLADEGILRSWIISMGRRSSLERVAHLTCELYVRATAIGLVEDKELVMPLSQMMLADALGMTTVHINRVLKELRIAGVMGLRRGALTILDPARLVAIAGFDENYLHRRLGTAAGLPRPPARW